MKRTTHPITRIISCLLVVSFLVTTILPPSCAYALSMGDLPKAGTLMKLSGAYRPAMILGVTVDPANPFKFNFIIDKGEEKLSGEELNEETRRQIKYFLAALTLEEKDLWVNLSPVEKDRITTDELGVTEMGRDLLAQDYLLKQIMSSLSYPEEETGRKFWERVYAKAQELFGTTDVSFDAFNKVWIVPDQADVYENGPTAFVMKSRLKVMLDKDYLMEKKETTDSRQETIDQEPISNHQPQTTSHLKDIYSQTSREVLIPEIEREVNEGKNFSQVRQIYNAVILANWYKQRLKESLLSQVYVNQKKVKGVDVDDKDIKEKIWNQYVEAFKAGVYNYIREDYDPHQKVDIPRKYFSGGATMNVTSLDVSGPGRVSQTPSPELQEKLTAAAGDNSLIDALVEMISGQEEDDDDLPTAEQLAYLLGPELTAGKMEPVKSVKERLGIGESIELSNGDSVFQTRGGRPVLITKEMLQHIRERHQAETDIAGSRVNSGENILQLIMDTVEEAEKEGLQSTEFAIPIGTDNLVSVEKLQELSGISLEDALGQGWIRMIPGQSINREAADFHPRAGRYEIIFDKIPPALKDKIVAQPTKRMNVVLGNVPASETAFPEAKEVLARWEVLRRETGIEDISNGFGVITAFPGVSAPKFPEDRRISSDAEREEAKKFWDTHVFVDFSPVDKAALEERKMAGFSTQSLMYELKERPNQDFYVKKILDNGLILLGVFDGLGSYEGSEQASRTAAEVIEKEMTKVDVNEPMESILAYADDAAERANREIARLQAANERLKGMATTATFAVGKKMPDGTVQFGITHVGDTRAHKFNRDGVLEYVTQDNTTVVDLARGWKKKGFLTAEQAGNLIEEAEYVFELLGSLLPEVIEQMRADIMRVYQRLKFDLPEDLAQGYFMLRNVLDGTLGRDTSLLGLVTMEIITLNPGDLLLLTSDGIHDNLTLAEIKEHARKSRVEDVVSGLIEAARERAMDAGENRRAKDDDLTAVAYRNEDVQGGSESPSAVAVGFLNSQGESYDDVFNRFGGKGREIFKNYVDPRLWGIDQGTAEEKFAPEFAAMSHEELQGVLIDIVRELKMKNTDRFFDKPQLQGLVDFLSGNVIDFQHHVTTPVAMLAMLKQSIERTKAKGTSTPERAAEDERLLLGIYKYKAFMRELVKRWTRPASAAGELSSDESNAERQLNNEEVKKYYQQLQAISPDGNTAGNAAVARALLTGGPLGEAALVESVKSNTPARAFALEALMDNGTPRQIDGAADEIVFALRDKRILENEGYLDEDDDFHAGLSTWYVRVDAARTLVRGGDRSLAALHEAASSADMNIRRVAQQGFIDAASPQAIARGILAFVHYPTAKDHEQFMQSVDDIIQETLTGSEFRKDSEEGEPLSETELDMMGENPDIGRLFNRLSSLSDADAIRKDVIAFLTRAGRDSRVDDAVKKEIAKIIETAPSGGDIDKKVSLIDEQTTAAAPGDAKRGGIAFDSLNVVVKRDASGVPLPLQMQGFEFTEIEGLTPVIVRVTAMTKDRLAVFFTRTKEEEEKDSVSLLR